MLMLEPIPTCRLQPAACWLLPETNSRSQGSTTIVVVALLLHHPVVRDVDELHGQLDRANHRKSTADSTIEARCSIVNPYKCRHFSAQSFISLHHPSPSFIIRQHPSSSSIIHHNPPSYIIIYHLYFVYLIDYTLCI